MRRSFPHVVAAAAAAMSLASVSTATAHADTAPPPVIHKHVIPAASARGQATAASQTIATSPMTYHSGSVLLHPVAYIDYWGSWSTAEEQGAMTYFNSLFQNLGGSTWSQTMTQYTCASTSCAGAVANGGAQFGGAWNDTVHPIPSSPTDAQIQQEAAYADAHFFGSTIPQGALVFVLSPAGANEAGFDSSWCGWHSAQVISSQLAPYAYLGYFPASQVCYSSTTGSSAWDDYGRYDGYSIVGGHEYAEAVTDPDASSGWYNASQGSQGEIGDLCDGNHLAPQALTFGAHAYPMQALFSNATLPNPCVFGTALPVTSYPASRYVPVTPTRIYDSRLGSGQFGPGTTRTVQVTGGLVPAGAVAAVLNIGVTNANGAGSTFVLAYPADQPQPSASSVNVVAGQTRANLTQVALSASGAVNVYNAAGYVDVFLDITGYYSTSSPSTNGLYRPLPAPARVLDTRLTHAPLGPTGSVTVRVAGTTVGGTAVPADATAVVVNLAAVLGTSPSFLQAYPTGQARPNTSNLNFPAGRVIANRAVIPVDPATGSITVYNSEGTVDVLVDMAGWFSGGGPADTTGYQYTPQQPHRVFDTRDGTGVVVGPIGPGGARTVPLGVTAPAVAANVTVLNATTYSYLGAYPTLPATPSTSDINFQVGDILPNLAITALSGSSFTVYNSAGSVDVFVDVEGIYS